jgi:hypothetical protein
VSFLATLAVLLLSCSGYSLGVVLKSGKAGVRKPVAVDVVLVILMGIGVVYSLSQAVLSKWIWLPIWIAAGLLIGLIVTAIKGYSQAEQMSAVEPNVEKRPLTSKRMKALREFSFKIGTFQSQILLGLLYLFGFGIIGLAVRFFSDPLRIKRSSQGSHWTPKPDVPADLEHFKRQF